MKKVIYILGILVFSIVFLVGCDLKINSEIYLRDISEYIIQKNDKLEITTTLRIEIISEDTYKENRLKITRILKKYFGEVENIRFEQETFQNYYVGEVNLPLTTNAFSENLIWFTADKDGNIQLNFNGDIFSKLKTEIFDEFYQTLDTKKMYVEITLINDLRKDVFIEVQGVYLNNIAYPFLEKIILKNRQKVTISFSDVLRDYMVERGKVKFVKIIF
ncbi:MAG: hypothetical protein NZ841_06865 [Dictyoglomus sp.]|nr:hypothetical protein [Dictyoglomus sp.]MCX7942591.1 hypothetical protein [Dictyoglomaceae bacterium]MDW8189001.1 hypothetical protein [Dictyoglomus sp.]